MSRQVSPSPVHSQTNIHTVCVYVCACTYCVFVSTRSWEWDVIFTPMQSGERAICLSLRFQRTTFHVTPTTLAVLPASNNDLLKRLLEPQSAFVLTELDFLKRFC